jgi:hypothetical protein
MREESPSIKRIFLSICWLGLCGLRSSPVGLHLYIICLELDRGLEVYYVVYVRLIVVMLLIVAYDCRVASTCH